MLLLLLLLIVGCNASLVLTSTGSTLMNGDFPFTNNLPIYNYTCVGSLLVATFTSSSCQIDTSVITASTILVVSWQNASSHGCTFYPDILPQIAGLAQLPCAILYVSTVNGDVGDYDNEPFGITTSPFLSFPAPLTLISNKVGTSLAQSILTNASFYTNAILTSQPNPYTILYESSNFQGYRWFFVTINLIILIIVFHLPFTMFRVLAFSCMTLAITFQLVEFFVDEAGSTGVLNKAGRIGMAWIALYIGHIAFVAVLLQWVDLTHKLKKVPKLIINISIYGTYFIMSTLWPLVIIFISVHQLKPALDTVALVFQVLLGVAVLFTVICYFTFGGVILRVLAESRKALSASANPTSSSSKRLQLKILQMTMVSTAAFLGVLIGILLSVFSKIIPTASFFFASKIVLQTCFAILLIALIATLFVRPSRKDGSTSEKEKTEKRSDSKPSELSLSDMEKSSNNSRTGLTLKSSPRPSTEKTRAIADILKRSDSEKTDDF